MNRQTRTPTIKEVAVLEEQDDDWLKDFLEHMLDRAIEQHVEQAMQEPGAG
jgi:hypothetical protein